MKTLIRSAIPLCVVLMLIHQVTLEASAQTVPNGRYATVNLEMPLKSNENQLPSGGDVTLDPILISESGKQHPFTFSKRVNRGSEDYGETFRVNIPAGRYRLAFRRDETIRLPAFNIAPGETKQLRMPINRVASADICTGGTITPRLDWDQQVLLSDEEKYEAGPFHELSTDVISPNPAEELVVNYCQMQINGNLTVYQGVKVFFRAYFVIADRLTVDRKTGRVVLSRDTWPMFIEMNGDVITTETTTFELYAGTPRG